MAVTVALGLLLIPCTCRYRSMVYSVSLASLRSYLRRDLLQLALTNIWGHRSVNSPPVSGRVFPAATA